MKIFGLEDGINKEWIITNGIGGFASSSIIGANTRRYHGLLIAPLTPPAHRNLILSKVDESIQIEDKKYDFFSNIGKDFISDGYKYQTSFEKEYIPIFTYQIEDTIIKKYICMQYGKNTVVVYYRVFNGSKESKLILTPLLNFRDFHRDSYLHEFDIKQEEDNKIMKFIIDGQSSNPIYIKVSDGEYIKHENDSYKNMFYIEEEKRGLPSQENHAIPGRYEVTIAPNELKEITFVASLEENIDEIDGKDIISKEIVRISGLLYDSHLEDLTKKDKQLLRDYIIAADNFIVYRPSFGLHTVIAGYPWFLDWGRDTLISFEGLLLKTKRFRIAQEVLLTMIRDVKYGLVPNRIFWI